MCKRNVLFSEYMWPEKNVAGGVNNIIDGVGTNIIILPKMVKIHQYLSDHIFKIIFSYKLPPPPSEFTMCPEWIWSTYGKLICNQSQKPLES